MKKDSEGVRELRTRLIFPLRERERERERE
jgi:hypothetical protein